jgi:hypothetical protein
MHCQGGKIVQVQYKLLPFGLIQVQLPPNVFLGSGVGPLAHDEPGGIGKPLEQYKYQYDHAQHNQYTVQDASGKILDQWLLF